ncbi:MAG: hypothetical protein KJ592_02235 [Nanoarchaeota archaeon]|nr:hypothetical protein [Nanoarchaeota archaeon]
MERKNKVIIILSAIAIIAIIYTNSQTLSKEIISTEFLLGKDMGFDLSSGKLNFGQIIPGHSASREITIDNNFKDPITVSIKSSGEISKYIIVSENNFLLNPSESKNATFTVYTDGITEFRPYKGKIIITSKKP